MENRAPILTDRYMDKADHFLQGMRLLADDFGAYRTSIGLLAIHSAISLNDAILAGVTGQVASLKITRVLPESSKESVVS